MPRDPHVFLDDMIEAAERIADFVKEMDFEAFAADRKTCDAVIRNLEVIGEAAKAMPEDVKSKSQGVEWKKLAGLRDILIHQYFGVDLGILWDVVENKLPLMKKGLEEIRKNL